MSEKHCNCGCIYLEAECPNCNRQSPQDRIKELEAQLKTMIKPQNAENMIRLAEPMLSDALAAAEERIEELEAGNQRLRLEVAHANDTADAAIERIEELEAENKKLRLGLEFYQRERDRFRHANPEMTGEYFLAGGHGFKYDSNLPQFVEICPAYGCAWVKIYEDTGRTISYEGS